MSNARNLAQLKPSAEGLIETNDITDASVTLSKLAAEVAPAFSVQDGSITAAKLDGVQSGTAPIYGARAWVHFNGSGTVSIKASGNVSSVSDLGVGYYRVNLTTAMPSVNFSGLAFGGATSATNYFRHTGAGQTTTTFAFTTSNSATTAADPALVSVVLFH